MTWLTEDSTIPMVSGAILAIVFFSLAMMSREKIMFYITLVIVLLTSIWVGIESMIVTNREEVQERVYNLAFHVQRNDLEEVMKYVDPDDKEIQRRIRYEMPRYKFETCRMTGVTDFKDLQGNPDRCEIVFNVAVRVQLGDDPTKLAGQRRVKLILQRDRNGDWRIIDYEHWDPRRGLTV